MSNGTYRWEPETKTWFLDLDPATAIRAKRMFTRASPHRSGSLMLRHTMEVARDIEWFMMRFPLTPSDAESEAFLLREADCHRDMKKRVEAAVRGEYSKPTLPTTLTKQPREYQLQAYNMLQVRRRMLLGDEVGLGKTLTGLLSVLEPEARPALVVPPTHLPSRWATELEESMPNLKVEIAKKTTPPQHILDGELPDVLIVTYSKIAGWSSALAGRVKTVIFDEVQDLRKGAETMKGSAAQQIADKADFVLGLTATPVYNYGGEVWHLYSILAPDALGTWEEFSREWANWTYNGNTSVANPAALGRYLREEGLFLARTRADVGRELPPVTKVPHVVDTDAEALEAIAGDLVRLAARILGNEATGFERYQLSGEIDWKLRQATGISKAPYVAQFVKMLLESEEKVALFAWHRAVWDIYQAALAEFKPVMYTGSESPAAKDAARKAFIEGDSRVLLMSLRSGAGVDGLQKVCSVAVFGELDWSPQVHEQAIGRFRRDGMDEAKPVVAYFLNAEAGSDPVILETLQVKRNQAEPLVNPDGKLLASANVDTQRSRALAEWVLANTQTKPSSARAAERPQVAPQLPVKWDGVPVTWVEGPRLHVCQIEPPDGDTQLTLDDVGIDDCFRCGSSSPRTYFNGRATTPVKDTAGLRLIAHSCPECGGTQVYVHATGETWDIDESDLGPEGSSLPPLAEATQ